jgi:hypothetical protein
MTAMDGERISRALARIGAAASRIEAAAHAPAAQRGWFGLG